MKFCDYLLPVSINNQIRIHFIHFSYKYRRLWLERILHKLSFLPFFAIIFVTLLYILIRFCTWYTLLNGRTYFLYIFFFLYSERSYSRSTLSTNILYIPDFFIWPRPQHCKPLAVELETKGQLKKKKEIQNLITFAQLFYRTCSGTPEIIRNISKGVIRDSSQRIERIK